MYKLIEKPNGGGSSIKDFNIKDDLLYVTRGTYGGVKVTGVIFNDSDLEYWFEGIIEFKDYNDIFKNLVLNDVDFEELLLTTLFSSYEKGKREGIRENQQDIQIALGI